VNYFARLCDFHCVIVLEAADFGTFEEGVDVRVAIEISMAVFFGNTKSRPRAMKREYTDTLAPYAPMAIPRGCE
jgi:hypothetical protein